MKAASVYSRHPTLERLSCQLKASRRVDAILDISGQECKVSKSLVQNEQMNVNYAKSGFKRLAHQDRHPERSEGSRSEILRCAQHDSPEKFHGKVYQCLEFWFRWFWRTRPK